jgi:hypothetical protein
MKLFTTSWRFSSGTLAAALLLAGCGESGPELATVTGTVTRDGKPLPNMRVQFQPEAGRPSSGNTDSQGVYALRYTSELDGAVPGKHRVYIVSAPNLPPPDFQGQVPVGDESDAVHWPEPVTVEAGENKIDFDLSQTKTSQPPRRRRASPSPQPLN